MSSLQEIKLPEDCQNQLNKIPEKLTVVNFGATWCAPCKILKPELENLANQSSYKDVVFMKALIDDEDLEEWVEELEILKVPTTIVYLGKKEIFKVQGADGAIEKLKKVLASELTKIQDDDF